MRQQQTTRRRERAGKAEKREKKQRYQTDERKRETTILQANQQHGQNKATDTLGKKIDCRSRKRVKK